MKKYVLRVEARNALGGKIARHWTIPEAMEDEFVRDPYGAPSPELAGHVRVFTVPLIPDYEAQIFSVQIVEHTLDDIPPQGYSERVEAMRAGFRAFLRHEIPLSDLVEMMAAE